MTGLGRLPISVGLGPSTTRGSNDNGASSGMKQNLKKAPKQREELSPERLIELTTTARTRPFDERRRPPPKRTHQQPRKFAEVDKTDPAFDIERIPVRGSSSGKGGRRPFPFEGEDFEGFGESEPLMEAPPSSEDSSDENGEFMTSVEVNELEDDKEDDVTVTTTTLRTDAKEFNVFRDKFEEARHEITTEFSHFNRRPPVEGGSYAVMTMGVRDAAAPSTGYASGHSTVAHRERGGHGKPKRPQSVESISSSPGAPNHRKGGQKIL